MCENWLEQCKQLPDAINYFLICEGEKRDVVQNNLKREKAGC
jgi:hypothetical protein